MKYKKVQDGWMVKVQKIGTSKITQEFVYDCDGDSFVTQPQFHNVKYYRKKDGLSFNPRKGSKPDGKYIVIKAWRPSYKQSLVKTKSSSLCQILKENKVI